MPAAEQLFEKISASRWTPVVVNLLALLLLSYSLAQWTWRLMEPAAAPRAQRSAMVVADNASDLRQLTNANLFGHVDLSAGQNNLSPATIPLTSLNVVLTGVMMRGDGLEYRLALAMLAQEGLRDLSIPVRGFFRARNIMFY